MGLRAFFAFLFFLALAVVFTWPLAASLDHTLSDPGDPLLNSFILHWDLHSFARHGFEAPILYPGRHALAYSENMLGIALLMIPFAALSPLAIHNVAMLIGFALSGLGAFLLARMITRSTPASLVAGVLYAFVPFKWDHLSHVQIISSGWLPLLLASLLAYRRQPSAIRAALFGAVFVMNGLTNIYWLLFGGFAVVVTILFLQIADKRMLAALVVACAVLVPVLIPYQLVAREYGMRRRSSESRQYSATPLDWLVPSGRSALYGVPASWRHAERELFPGVLMMLLPVVGALWGAGVPAGARRRDAGAPLRAVVLLAFVAVAMLFVQHDSGFTAADRVAAREITEWQAPTDFLLRTPGRELLNTTPSIPSKGVLR